MKRIAAQMTAVAAVAAAALSGGCVTPQQSAAADVNPASWYDAAEIVIPNADTVTLRDIGLFLRCNDRFAEDTLTVRVAVCTPDSLRHEEPFLLAVRRTEGPTALTGETDIPYRSRVRFSHAGDYRFRITPSRPVRGIEAVGIHIVKSE